MDASDGSRSGAHRPRHATRQRPQSLAPPQGRTVPPRRPPVRQPRPLRALRQPDVRADPVAAVRRSRPSLYDQLGTARRRLEPRCRHHRLRPVPAAGDPPAGPAGHRSGSDGVGPRRRVALAHRATAAAGVHHDRGEHRRPGGVQRKTAGRAGGWSRSPGWPPASTGCGRSGWASARSSWSALVLQRLFTREARARLIAVLAASALAAGLTPLGPRLLLSPFEVGGNARQFVSEWMASSVAHPLGGSVARSAGRRLRPVGHQPTPAACLAADALGHRHPPRAGHATHRGDRGHAWARSCSPTPLRPTSPTGHPPRTRHHGTTEPGAAGNGRSWSGPPPWPSPWPSHWRPCGLSRLTASRPG